MKIPLIFGCLLALATVTTQAATAYEALRVIGEKHGENLLDQIIEVTGTGGSPEPTIWKITARAKNNPQSAKQFDVRGKKIIAEREIPSAANSRPLDLNHLNLDSDGAYTLAERESKKNAFAYDSVNYTLRSDNHGGTPLWLLRLVDERDQKTTSFQIGADTGKILVRKSPPPSENRLPAESHPEDQGPPPPARPSDFEEAEQQPPPADETGEEEIDKPGTKVSRFAERVGRHIGGTFKKFGEKWDRAVYNERRPASRTIRKIRPSESERNYRDTHGTEFYRPRD